jgi:hypothetical protein
MAKCCVHLLHAPLLPPSMRETSGHH